MRILNNIPALQSFNALTSTNSALQKSINRLSTGLRINSAADDAAGLAISEKMRAQIRGLDQATSNAQDGISMIQTAEGALNETHSILQRMRELSVQAANDTLTQQDRGYIQLEIDQLKEEVTRISNTTQFNKKKLLDGTASVLWSSDNLQTKAIVNGGLRAVDQFGQKSAVEGNFKISINADPGQAEIQKTDIFKIKHKNVIMNVSLDQNNGFQSIAVDNLPAGEYAVIQGQVNTAVTVFDISATIAFSTIATALSGGAVTLAGTYSAGSTKIEMLVTIGANTAIASASDIHGRKAGAFYAGKFYSAGSQVRVQLTLSAALTGQYTAGVSFAALNANTRSDVAAAANNLSAFNNADIDTASDADGGFRYNSFYGLSQADFDVKLTAMSGVQNASMLFEVLKVDTAAGTVTFRAQVSQMDVNGKVTTLVDDNLVMSEGGVKPGYSKLGMNFIAANAMSIKNITSYDVGDKMVLNFLAATTGNVDTLEVQGQINPEWPQSWGGTAGAPVNAKYNVNMTAVQNNTIQFKHFYLNTDNGTVHQGSINIGFNTATTDMTAGAAPATRASFEAAYIGQVAKGDVRLRDLDKFWDANGRFMLEDSQQLTIFQGDGSKAQITLNSTDTLENVRKKLNDAIAFGLGQANYVSDAANNFVSFIDEDNVTGNTPDAVEGTFVIRSLIPGREGRLNFSGDEDVIKALSLNIIQDAKESTFNVSVQDAHTGNTLATNERVTGNVLRGVINNVDVQFDSMANIQARWNENTKTFDLLRDTGTYETILHLADNTTVFQIGANEGEDMGIDMGNMSASALGVDRVLVTDRESAARSITIIDSAIDRVSSQRAKLGAYQNRLEHTINNLTTASTNTTAAESRIRDVDMAKEMMRFTKLNILSQAGTSMLAQANQLPQGVLSLLR